MDQKETVELVNAVAAATTKLDEARLVFWVGAEERAYKNLGAFFASAKELALQLVPMMVAADRERREARLLENQHERAEAQATRDHERTMQEMKLKTAMAASGRNNE